MKTDGSIIIDTKIIDGGMEKGFELIKDEMASVGMSAKKVGEQIQLSFSKMDISKPIANAVARVQQLESQLEQVTSDFKNAVAEGDDKSAERLANKRISVYERLEAAREKLSLEIAHAAQKESEAEERAARKKEREAQRQYKDATKGARRFNSRLREIVSGALVFNLISAGLRSVTKYFGSALKSNKEFVAASAQLKGALLTAFQPIYEFIAPAITYLIKLLTVAAQAIGQFFAAISGKSYSQMQKNAEGLYNEANAINAVGGAAKEAKKQLMGFDEINRLDSMESGGGGGATGIIAPIFSEQEDSGVKEVLGDILRLVGAVAAALLTWKIASAFTNSLKMAAGLAMTVGGALLYATSWADAFSNGIDWGNLSGMLAGMIAIAGGLYLAFGSIASGVALVISGVGLAVIALKEWIETGELSNEACVALVGGIMAIGAAISLFTGSWIPLVIAGVASAVLAIWKYWDEIQAWSQNIDAKLTEIARLIYDFFADVINNIIESVVDGWNSFWRWIGGIGTGGAGMRTPDYAANYRTASYAATPEIPHLAKGAVIPANNKFLAVLGDQTSGRNLEAPEDLIRQIVREESGGGTSDRLAQLLEILIATVEGIEVGDEVIGKAAARYNRSTARARGY